MAAPLLRLVLWLEKLAGVAAEMACVLQSSPCRWVGPRTAAENMRI